MSRFHKSPAIANVEATLGWAGSIPYRHVWNRCVINESGDSQGGKGDVHNI